MAFKSLTWLFWEGSGGGAGYWYYFCRSVAKSCPTLCDLKDCSLLGSSVLHCLLEFPQIHVLRVGDAIQPSHPLLSPSPAFNLPQREGLFQ